MRAVISALLLVLGLLPPAQAQHIRKPPAAQLAAIESLAWLVGEWEGTGSFQLPQGKVEMHSWELGQRAAGGTALVLQGRHDMRLADGRRGERVHDAVALITYDEAAQRYKVVTHTQAGHGGSFEGRLEQGVFSWTIPGEKGHTRYDISRTDKDEWLEVGYRCTGTDPCREFFRMQLQRKRP